MIDDEGDFDEYELLSQETLIVETLRNLLKAYAELNRREQTANKFFKTLCGFSLDTQVWFILWESGGAQRFTDLLRKVECSRSKLSDVLRELLRAGLVRMVEKQYQAVSPAWLVRISEPNRR